MVKAINCEIYCHTTVFVFGKESATYEYLRKHLPKSYTNEEIKTAIDNNSSDVALTVIHTNQLFFVFVNQWEYTAAHFGVLQHEIFHVADQILREKGFVLTDDSDEAWAYLIQFYTRELYKFIIK